MKEKILKGKISFINHEKKYAIIEYDANGKKKTVNANIDEKLQKKLKEENKIRKTHHFLMGDVVEFKIKISDRGDRMIATNLRFLYNNALDLLIDRSRRNNRFTGYLKMADDKYYVKEIDSYLFFPVPFSLWQVKPTEQELNEPVEFSLENIDKKERISASLLSNAYIPEFHAAVKLFKNKTTVDATVFNITPHAIYLNVIGIQIQAKITIDKIKPLKKLYTELKTGDKIKVMITFISKSRIAVELADENYK